MLEYRAIKAGAADVWREVRADKRPVIAPYPELGPAKKWKWDRPLEKLIGRVLVDAPVLGRGLLARAEAILERFADLTALGEEAFLVRCREMRARLTRHGMVPDLVDECFALIREATGRQLGMRHYAVQLMGGLVMVEGGVAEMATGEGKTITALLPAITAALAGMPTHIFTVNDYLATRDLEKLDPVYRLFGLSTGLIVQDTEPEERRQAYLADVVYGTNKEIAFDYLKDQATLANGRGLARRRVRRLCGQPCPPLTMRGLHFAIVDEADSIFIDEARTPLILSATRPAGDDGLYLCALELSKQLEVKTHFSVKEAERAIDLTERGKRAVEALAAGLPQRLWRIRQAREQLAAQALSARLLFLKDRDYVVVDGKVQIVDESTGRTMPDRSWEGGLHQMVEAKEEVEVTGNRTTLARITYQRFFRRYRRLSGMSGTVREVAGELWADFGLRVYTVPTNRPCQRIHRGHVLVRHAAEKWSLIAHTVAAVRDAEGMRPVLVGTRSVADSDAVSAELNACGIAHRVLNARQDHDEAEIVARAGHLGAVTVATNMAGRGTDIEIPADVRAAGGLHVILTAFHETARVDRQLYGRAARQGDPGSSEAITALDDELYRHFAPQLAKTVASFSREWPVVGGAAKWLRRWAQSVAERRHAASRRQAELSEERLKESLALAGTLSD
ncbi:preprotein translocase subunit SecA [Sphingomonas radiodurans]|uniref:preprotein translocase subunit SecA n=1 Tax=Sphingomonas radiodurans TaxID=2890321 RepID=UPI001E47FB10|nr:RNA helicase SecA [Sphingomonas radiodurans]WBH15002.1 RNA helicase SecA [Sphingomonas radiodurans]